jgi:serine/threonine protein kinase
LKGDPAARPTIDSILTHRFLKHESDQRPTEQKPQEFHEQIEVGSVSSVNALLSGESSRESAAHLGHIVHCDVSPICRAVRLGNLEMVQCLLEHAQLDILPEILSTQDELYRYTALHWCATYGATADIYASADVYAEIANLLIDAGCITNLRNHRSMTAWDLAEQLGAQQVVHVFETAVMDSLEPQLVQHYNGRQCERRYQMYTFYRYRRLKEEKRLRECRPKADDMFHDDIQLEFARFTLWRIDLSTQAQNWLQIAQGGFGTVYKVTDVSPAIAVSGTYYWTVAIKIPNNADAMEELKAEVESLSILSHGAL